MHVGLDFGTTYSSICGVDSNAAPFQFDDYSASTGQPSKAQTPSAIYLDRDFAFVGKPALAYAEAYPGPRLVQLFKTSMGESSPLRSLDGRQWFAENIATLLFRKLVDDVRRSPGAEPLSGAVVGIPAAFGDLQRRVVERAADAAGLNLLALLHEPEAAALGYLSQSTNGVGRGRQRLLVFDWGGGTFDVAVVDLEEDHATVRALDGDMRLGGRDIDDLIVRKIRARFDLPPDGLGTELPADLIRLRRHAEQIKWTLSRSPEPATRMMNIAASFRDFRLTRDEFEFDLKAMIDKTISICERCLNKCSLGWENIDQVLLTGGSSQIPIVGSRLRSLLDRPGQELIRKGDLPQRAVGYGTAIRANQFSRERKSFVNSFETVVTHSFGLLELDVHSQQYSVRPLIQRNTKLSSAHAEVEVRVPAGQTGDRLAPISLVFVTYQDNPEVRRIVGGFSVLVPSGLRQFRLSASLDAKQILRAEAFDAIRNRKLSFTFTPEGDADATQRAEHTRFVSEFSLNPRAV